MLCAEQMRKSLLLNRFRAGLSSFGDSREPVCSKISGSIFSLVTCSGCICSDVLCRSFFAGRERFLTFIEPQNCVSCLPCSPFHNIWPRHSGRYDRIITKSMDARKRVLLWCINTFTFLIYFDGPKKWRSWTPGILHLCERISKIAEHCGEVFRFATSFQNSIHFTHRL